MTAKPTLHYFNAKGGGEVTRWMLALAKVDYSDKRYTREEWADFKPKTPFGQMPVLEVNGEMICQSAAIAAWVAREYGLYGSNNLEAAKIDMVCGCVNDVIQSFVKAYVCTNEEEKAKLMKEAEEVSLPKLLTFVSEMLSDQQYLVGNKVSLADINVVCSLDLLESHGKKGNPDTKTANLIKRVKELPEIANWLKNRPVTEN